MHQVTVTEATRRAVAAAEAARPETLAAAQAEGGGAAHAAGGAAPAACATGLPHLWRISSTLFAHANSAATLRPLLSAVPARLAAAAEAAGRPPPALGPAAEYPPMRAGEQVVAELRGIALARS